MSKSISEYLIQIQRMTNKNLQILKALNDSFYTKNQHIHVNVDGSDYVIPSFLGLENRLNTLQNNFENLVNAPLTGEAAFDFNGSTQKIEMKTFSNIPSPAFPSSIEDNQYQTFDFSKNNIFKDFCTPQPFLRLDLRSLPMDVEEVNVKKVVGKSEEGKELIKSILDGEDKTCVGMEWGDMKKRLEILEEGKDYQEYDKRMKMPIRYGLGDGTYHIQKILDNYTTDSFDEYYKLQLDTLFYYTKDHTIQKILKIGDHLLSNDRKVKMEITDLKVSDRTVEVKVMEGMFINLVEEEEDKEKSEIYYFNDTQMDEFKYLQIPLEEDQYVGLWVAPLKLGTQSPWGEGMVLNVYNLSTTIGGVDYYYKDYYDKFVNNVGDKLFDITDMFTKGVNNYSVEEFNYLTSRKPVVKGLEVMQINKHLNNSATIESIYQLYEQKSKYKDDLQSIQNRIDEVNQTLSTLDFSDTTQSRIVYEQQLKDLNKSKKELTQNLLSISKEIADTVSSTTTPIDNPKFRIRGMFDYMGFLKDNNLEKEEIIKIEVNYRYRNPLSVSGNAETLSSSSFNDQQTPIFSDWCLMNSEYNRRKVEPRDGGVGYKYEMEGDTSMENVVSFNQVDIPITQGEVVDIRLRCIYNIGYPFVEVDTDWSDVVTIEFPEELKQKITVLDIIEDNNEDIKNGQFRYELDKEGVTDHVDDKLIDQDVTYFHHADYIASGFYTDERRVIPLRDKLQSMNEDITELWDEVKGTSIKDLSVTVTDSVSLTNVLPYTVNLHVLPSYSTHTKENHVATEVLNLTFTNTGNHTIKLFSLFPGDNQKTLSSKTRSLFRNEDYIIDNKSSNENKGVWLRNEEIVNENGLSSSSSLIDERDYFTLQHLNQWMYFRINDPYDGEEYYSSSTTVLLSDGSGSKDVRTVNGKLYGGLNKVNRPYVYDVNPTNKQQNESYVTVFPSIMKWNDICIDSSDNYRYKVLQPGEFLTIPIVVNYNYVDYDNNGGGSSGSGTGVFNINVDKILSFDIRTSLYTDPINYNLIIRTKYTDTLNDKIKKQKGKTKYTPTVVTMSKTIN